MLTYSIRQVEMSETREKLISISGHGNRLKSIDALRGFVMVIMLVDHVRETFYLHRQVSDLSLIHI